MGKIIRIQFRDRDLRRAVPACSCALARCLSADARGRAAARPHLLSLGHACLRRRDRFGHAARPRWNLLSAERASLRELKLFKPVQLFLDAALSILARALLLAIAD